MAVVDRDLGFAEIMTSLKKLGGKEIKVGIQGDEEAEYKNGVSVIDVAIFNEYGTDKIPSRPFIRQCFALHSQEAYERLRKVVDFIERGGDVDLALGNIGQWYEDQMKNVLMTYPWKPNSPATIKWKGSSRPLLNTKQLRDSIRYKVE
ncbi:hypothetical protein [Mannheimia bovis]|nr:hypothetical protein [Mannheimia bovis]